MTIERNPSKNLTGQLATLYDVAPDGDDDDDPGAAALALVTAWLLALLAAALHGDRSERMRCSASTCSLTGGSLTVWSPLTFWRRDPDDHEPDRPAVLRELVGFAALAASGPAKSSTCAIPTLRSSR